MNSTANAVLRDLCRTWQGGEPTTLTLDCCIGLAALLTQRKPALLELKYEGAQADFLLRAPRCSL